MRILDALNLKTYENAERRADTRELKTEGHWDVVTETDTDGNTKRLNDRQNKQTM